MDRQALKAHKDMVVRALKEGSDRQALILHHRHLDEGHLTPRTIIYRYGDWEGAALLIQMFFNHRQFSNGPRITDPRLRAIIFNFAGFYLKGMGAPRMAPDMFSRCVDEIKRTDGAKQTKDRFLAIVYRNLADTFYTLGSMSQAEEFNKKALAYSKAANAPEFYMHSLVLKGMLMTNAHRPDDALEAFDCAEVLHYQIYKDMKFLQGPRGVNHATCLMKADRSDGARLILEYNLNHTASRNQPSTLCLSHCVLGHLDLQARRYEDAEKHRQAALEQLKRTDSRLEKLEYLRLHGLLAVRQKNRVAEAVESLEKALALAPGHEFHRADVLMDLAWAYKKQGRDIQACETILSAESDCRRIGYEWGRLVAQKIRKSLGLDSSRDARIHELQHMDTLQEKSPTHDPLTQEEAPPLLPVPPQEPGSAAWLSDTNAVTAKPPRVLISYSHDSEAHRQRVLGLAQRLRGEGIDCRVDLFVSSPPEGFPEWMEREFQEADKVLVVCTETYHRRFNRDETPGMGLGVTWEAGLIRQYLYDAGMENTRIIPVIFDEEDRQNVPFVLRKWMIFLLPTNHDALYAHLFGRPLHEPVPLGPLRRSSRAVVPIASPNTANESEPPAD